MMNYCLDKIDSLGKFSMFVFLDILSMPGLFMGKRKNARYHVEFICPLCPEFRRKFRDVHKDGKCWWQEHWKKENYEIPRNFSVKNWLRSYLRKKTDLGDFLILDSGKAENRKKPIDF